MIEHPHSEYNKQVYYRLIALWVSCEAFAGGIMHGIKLPFSGLIVSSLAIICIVLIAYHVPSPSSIIKATLIVVIFKFILSPHSPPTAYIAVLFQGILGQILFRNHRYFKLAAIILAILGLVESAIQRILVLMIVYGNDLWKAINIFIQKLTREKDPTNYSLVIGIAYIILHAVIGIFVGIFATRLAKNSLAWKDKYPSLMVRHASPDLKGEVLLEQKHDPRKIKIIFILIWLALVLFYIQGKLYPANTI
ncbi:MAG: hypothetical protein ABIO04_12905, partial [Ferruginibacter sp.]